jgi:hypothetical protein
MNKIYTEQLCLMRHLSIIFTLIRLSVMGTLKLLDHYHLYVHELLPPLSPGEIF